MKHESWWWVFLRIHILSFPSCFIFQIWTISNIVRIQVKINVYIFVKWIMCSKTIRIECILWFRLDVALNLVCLWNERWCSNIKYLKHTSQSLLFSVTWYFYGFFNDPVSSLSWVALKVEWLIYKDMEGCGLDVVGHTFIHKERLFHPWSG